MGLLSIDIAKLILVNNKSNKIKSFSLIGLYLSIPSVSSNLFQRDLSSIIIINLLIIYYINKDLKKIKKRGFSSLLITYYFETKVFRFWNKYIST